MEKKKYKIGEFSKLARVTVRTLRHYEDIGLLKPDIVDMWTGYRYYSPGQLQKLLFIIQLKDLGFTLSEIALLYDEDSHYPSASAIESKIKDCEQQDNTGELRCSRDASLHSSRPGDGPPRLRMS